MGQLYLRLPSRYINSNSYCSIGLNLLKIFASNQVVVFCSQVGEGKVFLVVVDVGICTRVEYLGILEFEWGLTSTKHDSMASWVFGR